MSQHYGWRVAFYSAGLPGLVLAVVLWLTVSEPPRGTPAASVKPEPVGPTLRVLAHQRSFVIVLIGFGLTSFTNYATSIWIPPFLARVHHLSSAEIGFYAGTFKGLCGMVGTLAGGLVVTRISARDDRWKLWAPAVMSAQAGPVFAGCLLTHSFPAMIVLLALASSWSASISVRIFAIGQTVARPNMRALASAILLLMGTCFGQGLGPLTVGLINDALKYSFGADAIRYSLLSASLDTPHLRHVIRRLHHLPPWINPRGAFRDSFLLHSLAPQLSEEGAIPRDAEGAVFHGARRLAHQPVCFESPWMIIGQYSSSDCDHSSYDCLRGGALDVGCLVAPCESGGGDDPNKFI